MPYPTMTKRGALMLSSALTRLARFSPAPLKIRHKIFLFVILFFNAVLLTTAVLVERISVSRLEQRFEQNALDIAHIVAEIPQIKENVGRENGAQVIQPLVEAFRVKTVVEFIVVMDMESTRYSHPVPERIGQKFVGGDEGPSLRGETYTSTAVGTLGRSMRAFVPIYRNNTQVGAVSVGILTEDINRMISDLRRQIFWATLAAFALGFAGSAYLAKNIKQAMLGLEPDEISTLLYEREAILESVREGIVAVDAQERVIFVNSEARRLLDLNGKAKRNESIPALHIFPLKEVLGKGIPVYDVELSLAKARVLSNSVPIRDEQKQVRGAIVSFRDMTEIRKMAEELTGVMRFVETLRVQNHEFDNKLHTIAGLIQLGEYDEAIQYISRAAASQRKIIAFVSERIKDSAVAAVLLGKVGRARELGIDFIIHPDSFLGVLRGIEGTTLATIIANLVDNAMEAVQCQPEGNRKVEVTLFDEHDGITISVKDNGPGISTDFRDKIFEKGFTTGKDEHLGLGLYIVKSFVDSLNGEIDAESREDKGGTEFSVFIPHGK